MSWETKGEGGVLSESRIVCKILHGIAGHSSRLDTFFCLVLLTLWSCTPSMAQADFDSGLRAFQKGNYKAAMKEFHASASEDDPRGDAALGNNVSLRHRIAAKL